VVFPVGRNPPFLMKGLKSWVQRWDYRFPSASTEHPGNVSQLVTSMTLFHFHGTQLDDFLKCNRIVSYFKPFHVSPVPSGKSSKFLTCNKSPFRKVFQGSHSSLPFFFPAVVSWRHQEDLFKLHCLFLPFCPSCSLSDQTASGFYKIDLTHLK
jgi:hypothetical protein